MSSTNRRQFLRATAGTVLPLVFARRSAAARRAITVEDIRLEYEDFPYRTPIKFGGNVLDRVTLLNVHCVVRGADGKSGRGFGSMPLGNIWAFPSQTMSYDVTLGAMRELSQRIAKTTREYREAGHPIDITHALEPEYFKLAEAVSRDQKLAEPIPKLATLVTASPVDAALHDAYGKLHGVNCYHTYGPDFMLQDLGHYLGNEFRGESLDRYVLREPKPVMHLYHLVGALDPIVAADVSKPVGDGLPETLEQWIPYSGLTHLKIKLNGDDLKWDVERVLRVDRTATEVQARRAVRKWFYSCDFNEKCRNVDYLLSFLGQVKEKSPAGFERIQYIEQPTRRDLTSDRSNVMHEAAKLRPVVIDESLVDKGSLLLAREMGYTGVALKACKGQSQSVLMAALAQKHKMFLCVQDLTCPSASLIHSAGLAAHIPGVAAIEANSRQYVPVANKAWEKKFPGVFDVRDGRMNTGILKGPGLGAV